MAEEIDVLTQRWEDAAHFTVNTAVASVPLVIPALPAGELMRSDGKNYFDYKDNFILLSLGIALPLSFEFIFNDKAGAAHVMPFVDLKYQKLDDSVVDTVRPTSIYTIFESYELSLGNFVIPPTGIGIYRLLFQCGAAFDVSMLGVPAAFNELVFASPVFAKVLHTLALSGEPED